MTDIAPIKIIEDWLNQRTMICTEKRTYTSIAYVDYTRFCARLNLQPVTLQLFGVALHLCGIKRKRTKHGSLISLSLQPSPIKVQRQTQAKTNLKRRLFR